MAWNDTHGHRSLNRAFRSGGGTRGIHIPEAELVVTPNYSDVLASYYLNGDLQFSIGDESDPVRYLRGDPMGTIDGMATRRQALSLVMGAGITLFLIWCSRAHAHKIFMAKMFSPENKLCRADALTTTPDYLRLHRLANFINGKPV